MRSPEVEACNADFGDGAQVAKAINAWVEDKTEQMIKVLVTPMDVLHARLVLVNAIYFKGIWQDQFDPAATFDGDFRLLDGTTKRLPMMARSGELLAYQDETLQAVSLP
jgi:serpin B